MQKLSYSQAIKRSHLEAVYTTIAAVLLFVFFWGAIALTQDCALGFFGLPLWFWLSCIGGYLLSVAVVWGLVKYFFRDFDLQVDDGKKPGEAL